MFSQLKVKLKLEILSSVEVKKCSSPKFIHRKIPVSKVYGKELLLCLLHCECCAMEGRYS